MSEALIVTTSTETKEQASKIGKAVVEQRLAACAQIMGPIESHYWWEGKRQHGEEWLCILKTNSDCYPELEATIKSMHSYDTPEILAAEVRQGHPDYLAWLQGELKK